MFWNKKVNKKESLVLDVCCRNLHLFKQNTDIDAAHVLKVRVCLDWFLFSNCNVLLPALFCEHHYVQDLNNIVKISESEVFNSLSHLICYNLANRVEIVMFITGMESH